MRKSNRVRPRTPLFLKGENKMGRPLNKKYMGNRNVGLAGTYTASDSEIGGSELSGITVTAAGTYNATNADALTTTFPAPFLANGTTAVGTPNFKVKTATIAGTQTRAYPSSAGALSIGSGAAQSTYTATTRTGTLTTVVRTGATTIGFDTTTTAFISVTDVLIGGTITGTATIGGVAIASGQRYYLGAPTTATSGTLYASYDDSVNATNPLTIVANTGFGGATFTVGGQYSTVTAVTIVNGGSIAKGAVTAYATATAAVVAGNDSNVGSGLTITPATFGVTSATFSVVGDGYAVNEPTQTLNVTFTGSNNGSAATGTIVAKTDDTTQAAGSLANRENAIIAYAYINGALREVDLVKQISSKRYKVNYGGTNYVARIRYDAVADGTAGYTAAEGYELNIVALDSAGGSYLVRKLFNRTCTLNPVAISRLSASAGSAVTAGQQVKWSFNAATSGVVQIENA
jgi:hypothetical protein